MSDLEALVEAAIDAAGAVVDVSRLAAAWGERQASPVHLRVVGRRSVGKSTLVEALTGVDRATGLGGVTVQDAVVAGEGVVVHDTVAIEEPLAAADALEAALAELDALVWVVDGLQPLTGIEREALDDAVPDRVALHVLVSRLDLVDAEEHAAILERVRLGVRQRAPLALAGVDPRAPDAELLASLRSVPWARSPRRRARLLAAAQGIAAVLATLDLPDIDGIITGAATAWRERVGDHHDAVVAEVKAGRHLFRDEAALSLHGRLEVAARTLADEVREACGATWSWRPAEPAGLDVWGQAQDLVAGTPGVLRALREAAATWATEGSLAVQSLRDGPACSVIIAHSAAIDAARAAVAALVADLDPDTPRA